MQLDSARELKQILTDTVLGPITGGTAAAVKTFALSAGPVARIADPLASLALGIAPKKGGGFQLAVRCQRPELLGGKEVAQIRKKAKNEVDVRFVGRVRKLATPWYQRKTRPLQIGISVGHFNITAGTLGGFVRLRNNPDGPAFILSNNHVLADENRGKVGDAILQPGALDGGVNPDDKVAELTKMIRLKKGETNTVDCAIARIDDGITFDPKPIKGLGAFAGRGPDFLDEGTVVAKLGRTTGLTRGRVTAFELDNVVVAFDLGNLRFDNQVEIEGADTAAFSAGGDSGSLIVVEGSRLAVALLFAGGDVGGTNGLGLTFANPIGAVLDALKIDLITG
ncbi:MAG: hypothetical protein ACRC7O_04205 [Fimbriiglobus sp.]